MYIMNTTDAYIGENKTTRIIDDEDDNIDIFILPTLLLSISIPTGFLFLSFLSSIISPLIKSLLLINK